MPCSRAESRLEGAARSGRMAMRRKSIRRVSMLCGLLAAAAFSTATVAVQDTSANRIGADLSFLADDLLEGRSSQSKGYDIAARYVAAQMRSIGLRPGGGDGAWLQSVPMLEARAVVRSARLAIRYRETSLALEPLIDFIPEPSFLTERVRVNAAMIFVGFGVSAPEFGYDSFRDVDVNGKVVVFLDGMPTAIPAPLHVFFKKQRARQLSERGAVGSVEIPMHAQEELRQWSQSTASAGAPKLRLLDEDGRPVDVHRASEAAVILNVASSDRLLAIVQTSTEAIWAEARKGSIRSFEVPGRIEIETMTLLRQVASSNVVGILDGRAGAFAGEYLVLMAHLDHVGRARPVEGDGIYNGALDNAAGVAVMLEAARILASQEPRLGRSVIFLATTAEEWGLLGSRHYALNPTVPRTALVAAINIDMPVPLYTPRGYTAVGEEHSTLGDVARAALEMQGLQILPVQKPERGLFAFTDQFSFVRQGIPALYVHEGPEAVDPSIDATGIFEDYLAHTYHSPRDDLSLPIDLQVLARLARVNASICSLIANDPHRPEWRPEDFFGVRFGNGRGQH